MAADCKSAELSLRWFESNLIHQYSSKMGGSGAKQNCPSQTTGIVGSGPCRHFISALAHYNFILDTNSCHPITVEYFNTREDDIRGRCAGLKIQERWFDSTSSHHYGLVVQKSRMPACHAGGRRFESVLGRQQSSAYGVDVYHRT